MEEAYRDQRSGRPRGKMEVLAQPQADYVIRVRLGWQDGLQFGLGLLPVIIVVAIALSCLSCAGTLIYSRLLASAVTAPFGLP